MKAKFSPVLAGRRCIGYEHRFDKYHIFFGNRWGREGVLTEVFPKYTFHFLKQVHGNFVTRSGAGSVEADGHWTETPHQALAIRTADCLPVLLAGSNVVCAIHCGWRGLERKILASAIQIHMARAAQLQAFLGPHIGVGSFEVGRDVAQRLLQVYSEISPGPRARMFKLPPLLEDIKFKKLFFDLKQLAVAQLFEQGLPLSNIHLSRIDTFANRAYHSHRRDLGTAGRQISFVCKTC